MTVFNVISMLGGLALFLYGMKIMGDGLKRGSSGALKSAIEKVTNNAIKGFLLGLVLTSIIQSSTATIVLTAGLVGAGVISLRQSLGIIIGANVGTTVTGQIIRLLDLNTSGTGWLEFLKPSTLAPIAAVIGIIIIMAIHTRGSEVAGSIIMGFAVLFTGLLAMTNAVAPLSNSPEFGELFIRLADKPLLGFAAGTAVSFILQSSSATVGILQALSVTGKLSLGAIYPILLGIYLGDCVTTAIVCSIGAKPDQKRTGVIHIIFNICSGILVFIVMTCLYSFTPLLDKLWGDALTSGGIANVNTIFKLACAILLLPLCTAFEKFSKKIVKDEKLTEKQTSLASVVDGLNTSLYKSPELALVSAQNAISNMAHLACDNVSIGLSSLLSYDEKSVKLLNEDEQSIDTLADKTSDYLINLSPYSGSEGHRTEKLNFYLKCISEFERIGDHAVNLTENGFDLKNNNSILSASAFDEIAILSEALSEVMTLARDAFVTGDIEIAKQIEPIEEVIDDVVAMLRENHLDRLRGGKCSVDSGIVFMDILTNVERISDQCSNVGVYAMGMKDAKIAVMQHDYLRSLHQGTDEVYNKRYAEKHDYYFGKIEAIRED